jgi:aerobic-type carbon monoxide dehydrogenase small subunit (CoxS/CutS family)
MIRAATTMTLTLTLNGVRRRLRVPPMARLLDVLREDCGLTGTKEGCGEGECGACTVLVDGVAVDSCLVPAAHAEGTAVTTIEGAGRTRQGRSLQDSFEACGAAQCGICTPGMIIAAMSVRPAATTDAITGALAGNLCRCTGYTSIIRAVQQATRAPRSRRSSRSSRTRAHGRAS